MEFTDRIKAGFSLAEEADVRKQNVAILDLRLRTLFVNSHSVCPLYQVTRPEYPKGP